MPFQRTSNLNFGFTLVEFLVVLGILVIAVASTLLFLTSVLKGSNQGNVVSEVKQNGQAVLDSLDRQIRNASDVQCKNTNVIPDVVLCSDPLADKKYLKLVRPGANPLHIKCLDPQVGVANGWIGTVEAPASIENPTTFVTITNQDIISGVSISNCNFSVFPASAGVISPPIVSIRFDVNQGVKAPSRADFLANAQFQTTISLRKY